MKKFIIPAIIGLALLLQPAGLSAATFCFSGSGIFILLAGGKPDQKPFSGNITLPGVCTIPAWGSIIRDSLGNYHMSINAAHHPTAPCTSIWLSTSGPSLLSTTGHYDNQQNGTVDNVITLTQVNCNTIPTMKPEKIDGPGPARPSPED